MDREVTILYEDAELIVCRKPAGIAVQSARVGQKDMVSILNNLLADRQTERRDVSIENCGKQAARRELPAVYVVHRLDQPVEGVLVFAKTKRAAAELSRQVADGSMEKVYWAVCCATKESFEVENYHLLDYLVKDGRTNTSSVASQGDGNAKRAELFFRVLKKLPLGRSGSADEYAKKESFCQGSDAAYYLVEIELKTGRHHQIRVQMAHAGLPLYGDQKYNNNWKEFLLPSHHQQTDSSGKTASAPALCAVSLTFVHPTIGQRMTFQTEPGADIFRYVAGGEGQL